MALRKRSRSAASARVQHSSNWSTTTRSVRRRRQRLRGTSHPESVVELSVAAISRSACRKATVGRSRAPSSPLERRPTKQRYQPGVHQRALSRAGRADHGDELLGDQSVAQRDGDVVTAEEVGGVGLAEGPQALVRVDRRCHLGAQRCELPAGATSQVSPPAIPDGVNTPSGRPTASRQATMNSAIDSYRRLDTRCGCLGEHCVEQLAPLLDRSRPGSAGGGLVGLCINVNGDRPASSSHSMQPKLKMSD